MKFFVGSIITAVTLFLGSQAARAGVILSMAPKLPDINTSAITITYTYTPTNGTTGTGIFTATSNAGQYKTTGGTTNVSGAPLLDLRVKFNITNSGATVAIASDSGNHLIIQSTLPTSVNYFTAPNGSGTPTLFEIGKGAQSGEFGFEFTEISGLIGPVGSTLAVQLDARTMGLNQGGTTLNPAFNASFTGIVGVADSFTAVPLPPAVWSGIAGLAAVSAMTLLRRRSVQV